MDEERWRLSPEGFEQITSGDHGLDEEEFFFARILQSYEALETDGASEDDLAAILTWYQQAQSDQMLIDMVQRGLLYIFWKDGEVCFTATPEGKEAYNLSAEHYGKDPIFDDLPSLD